MDDFNDITLDGEETLGEQPKQTFQPPSFFQIAFAKMTKDMRFVGMYYVITGGLACLSIVGAIIGVPTIFIGLRMREAADQFDSFKLSNNPKSLRKGFELQGKSFNIQKIMIIVGIAIGILYIVGLIFFLIFAVSSFNDFG